MALRRLTKDFASCESGCLQNCKSVELVNEDMFHWHVILQGPKETPYEGGLFRVNFQFPATYPSDPPKVNFITPIYHPLISSTGFICLSYLRKGEWAPIISVNLIIMDLIYMIQLEIHETNYENWCWNAPISEFTQNRQLFEENARRHTLQYAFQ